MKKEKDITTIKLGRETKERLDKLRESRSESYDDILKKILYVLNTTRDDPVKAKRILERISELRERMIDASKQEIEEIKQINLDKKNELLKKKELEKKKRMAENDE
jgi:predicted DNA-binding protein